MIRKKPAPDLIRGRNRFSEKIMLNEAPRLAIDDFDVTIPARRLCRLQCNPLRWNSNWPLRVDRPLCITPTLRPLKAGPPHFRCSDDTLGQCGTFRAGCLVVHQREDRTRLAGILWAGQQLAAAIAASRCEIGQASIDSSIDLARQFIRIRFCRRNAGGELSLPFRVLILLPSAWRQ
jgi:hypothetical protein